MPRPEHRQGDPDSGSRASRLRRVCWLGGASGAGKSTIARSLAAKHGLVLYSTDEAMASYVSRWRPEDCQFLAEFKG